MVGGGDWTNVIIPGSPQSTSFNHRQSYEITNLKQVNKKKEKPKFKGIKSFPKF